MLRNVARVASPLAARNLASAVSINFFFNRRFSISILTLNTQTCNCWHGNYIIMFLHQLYIVYWYTRNFFDIHQSECSWIQRIEIEKCLCFKKDLNSTPSFHRPVSTSVLLLLLLAAMPLPSLLPLKFLPSSNNVFWAPALKLIFKKPVVSCPLVMVLLVFMV